MTTMEVRKSTEEDLAVFDEWHKHGRIEEITCKPILDGKRMPLSADVVRLTFFMEGYDEPVGKFSYYNYNSRNRSCEFGYILNPKYRGQGLGEKMIGFCIDQAFNDPQFDLNKLYCQTAEFNIPSVKILEKLGFKRDGVLREHHELDGKLWNDFVFSVLKSEWKYEE